MKHREPGFLTHAITKHLLCSLQRCFPELGDWTLLDVSQFLSLSLSGAAAFEEQGSVCSEFPPAFEEDVLLTATGPLGLRLRGWMVT